MPSLFADFVILSRESVYTTNFMKYGFTPGMGATYIIPKKLGISLGEELLLNAGNYRGADLEKRGVPFPVYARSEVPGQALQLARQIAEKPRLSLMTLTAHLVAPVRQELPAIIAQEVAMHDQTFHQPEVKERIIPLFELCQQLSPLPFDVLVKELRANSGHLRVALHMLVSMQ